MFPKLLPQELYDLIVDFCRDDVHALRACSLTSQALHHSSRAHIFRSITVDSMDLFNRFCFLLRELPDVAGLVQELHFNTYHHFMRREPFVWIHHSAAFPAGTFKGLKVVRFSYVRFDHLSSYPVMPGFYQQLTNYRGIRELGISSCDFESLGALEDFVSRFAPQSEMSFTLSLDCVRWGNPVSAEQIAPSSTGLRLSALAVSNFSRPDIIGLRVLSTPSAHTLRTVALKCVIGQELSGVGGFLRNLGNVLEYLQLGLRFDSTPSPIEDVQDMFDLSRNTNLRSLHLRILDLDYQRMRWVPALLQQVAHVPLQYLAFDIWLYSPAQLISPSWDDIAATLSSNPFKTVQDVLFIHYGALQFTMARTALGYRLPALAERRVLRVRDCSKPLQLPYC
ncbi:hypothetical protein DAEQUDRAFT_812978 [Daedalea quercina L-15889]|uniref:F-box domain-containing protein n=1 Tax=Daedalea quercina L-15889 TaxID=1314783 RepID=A0A165NRD0_9APHY|nr:hypothetical protein DAEQUDRAFT_812978 [Daedalea quercina L-15889]